MLRIAICDDEAVFSAQTEAILNHWPDKPSNFSTSIFCDGDSLIRAHNEDPFDIILLDVLMPLFDGIETAREIRSGSKDVKIVFLTSSPEFAVDSYTVKASNYLLKPVDPFKLFDCLNEICNERHQGDSFINVKVPHAVRRVVLSEIEYVEAQKKHVLLALTDGRRIESIEPFYVYEKKLSLSEGFFKCHRSYIVNIHRIDSYTSKEVRTESGFCIPISRSCHKEFEDAYFSAIFGKAGENQ
ncbi:MAG: response regulator transcription factor [Firmicutes bacterium]|nr:response regulator transcription factor [Bacillota bacterium]